MFFDWLWLCLDLFGFVGALLLRVLLGLRYSDDIVILVFVILFY